jgi:hypothetical protein
MPVVVKLDTVEDSRLSYGNDGWTIERGAYVYGLTGTGLGRVLDAKDAIGASPYLCTIGAVYPDVRLSNLYLQQIDIEAQGKEFVKFKMHYAAYSYSTKPKPNETRIEVGASCSQQQTNQSYNGANLEDISLSYLYADPPSDLPKNPAETSCFVPRYIAEVPLSFSKQETVSAATLFARARTYVGTVNSGTWYNGVAGTWLCNSIRGNSQDGGVTFTVTYTFLYREDSWRERAVFIDSYTGKPPKDLVEGTGKKWCTVYRATDFGAIGVA